MKGSEAEPYKWEFKARFRRGAFGWRSQPAIQRVKQAVSEIKKVSRKDPVLAAEGAVMFLQRVAAAIEGVDSSSGSMGTTVNRAIGELVPLIARAPADAKTRAEWLDRLWEAQLADEIPYTERVADFWGELCASKEVASEWADRLLPPTREVLERGKGVHEFFKGTSACLSALYRAERHAELVERLKTEGFWPYKRWGVKALAAMGMTDEALRQAESDPGGWIYDNDAAAVCEEILLSAGRSDEAYSRYGQRATAGPTYLATFRAIAKKYPHKPHGEILADLVKASRGEEGKWFATAKEAGLYDEALALARRSPCDPRTLTRAARDLAEVQPAFAVEAGLLALHWIVHGYGYEITGADVLMAHATTLQAAEKQGNAAEVRERIRRLAAEENSGSRFVARILGWARG